MTLETLHILRRCLLAQKMDVGDPTFKDVAPKVVAAMIELDEAIAAAENADTAFIS